LMLDRGEAFERRLVRSEARLRRGGVTGAWLGVALERSFTGAGVPAAALLGLGAWTSAGDVALAFSLEQGIASARASNLVMVAPAIDTVEAQFATVFEDRLVRATSMLVSGRWVHGRIGFESVAGVTLSPHVTPSRWMQTSIDVSVRPRLSVYATLGDPAPRWLALEPELARRASLGLKLTSEANAAAAEAIGSRSDAPEFRLRRLGEGWYVVEVRAAAGGPVEVMGDFSAWEPRALRHVTGRRWALALRMEPGVHQIQVRVDGGLWLPPAGLPVAADGFTGEVGVFIAK
ncbi:MAG: glycogen-binding domain-containing protein, partial [Candidatus Eiseniibacteriota bacterium]